MIYLKSIFLVYRTDCANWEDCICSQSLRLGVASQRIKKKVISDFIKVSPWIYSYACKPVCNQEGFNSIFCKNPSAVSASLLEQNLQSRLRLGFLYFYDTSVV